MISPRVKQYPAPGEGPGGEFEPDSSQGIIVRMVGHGKRVLELGCSAGYISRQLTARGNYVTGVDLNANAVAEARRHIEEAIAADLDSCTLSELVPGRQFDVIVFGDVLEHLREPLRLLKEARSFLSPNGYAVVSIPNVAHGNVRLSLLRGAFDYAPCGVLDDTHLHFFTQRSLRELCVRAGFRIDAMERTKVPLFHDSDVVPRVDEGEFSLDLVDEIRGDREHDTLQFIVRVLPVADEDHLRFALDELRLAETRVADAAVKLDRAERRIGVLQAAAGRVEELEAALRDRSAEAERAAALAEELRERLGAAEAALGEIRADGRVEALRESLAEIRRLRADLLEASRAAGEASGLRAAAERAYEALAARYDESAARLAELERDAGLARASAANAGARLAEAEEALRRGERERGEAEREHAAALAAARLAEQAAVEALADVRRELETRADAAAPSAAALESARAERDALAQRLSEVEHRTRTRESELVRIAEERSAALVTLAREHAAALADGRRAAEEATAALAVLREEAAALAERLAEAEEVVLANEVASDPLADQRQRELEAERDVLAKRLADGEESLAELWEFLAARERELAAVQAAGESERAEFGRRLAESEALTDELWEMLAARERDFEELQARAGEERDAKADLELAERLREAEADRAALAERLTEAEEAALAREATLVESVAQREERDAANSSALRALEAELRDARAAHLATIELFKRHVDSEVASLRAEAAEVDGLIRSVQRSWAWTVKTLLVRVRRRLPGGRARV